MKCVPRGRTCEVGCVQWEVEDTNVAGVSRVQAEIIIDPLIMEPNANIFTAQEEMAISYDNRNFITVATCTWNIVSDYHSPRLSWT